VGEQSGVNLLHGSEPGRKYLTAVAAGLAALQLNAGSLSDQEKLVAANTAFAFNLAGRVAGVQSNANVFLSPFSVSCALEMAADGAGGDTRAEIEKTLETTNLPANALNPACASLLQQFTSRKDVTVNLACGLWFQQGMHLKPAFEQDNRTFFQAELAAVNFGSPDSAKTINAWADGKTEGRIKEVVQFPFPPATRMVLANAIYFKGDWTAPFQKAATHPRDFHLPDGRVKPAPMMSREAYFVYQETHDFQAVQLDYTGGFQMELFLPATNSSPRKLLAAFAAPGSWERDAQSGFSRHDGSVVLPKFKIEFDAQLNDALKAMGIKKAFTSNAEFSGIADEPLFISEVKQKSFVEVDEAGTVAAAVTTVGMATRAAQMASPIGFVLLLDRPFLFVITDKQTGSVLFVGMVNDPG